MCAWRDRRDGSVFSGQAPARVPESLIEPEDLEIPKSRAVRAGKSMP
jgi:hypothetical protein